MTPSQDDMSRARLCQASTGSRSPATTTRASAIAALEDLRLTYAGTFAQNPEPFALHSNEIPDAVRQARGRAVSRGWASSASSPRCGARRPAGPSPPGVVPAPLRRHRPEHSDGAVRLTEHGRDGASSVHASSASSKERLAARPAGSASSRQARAGVGKHLEPSHANARRLFERDIEGPVTTLNLLRLPKPALSRTRHVPRRGRGTLGRADAACRGDGRPDSGRDPPRSLDPDASGPIEGGQSQTRPRSSCGLAEESRTDARRAANIPPRSMCDALHAPRGLLVTPGGKPWSTVDPAAATTPSDQQRGMLSPRRSRHGHNGRFSGCAGRRSKRLYRSG